MGEDKDQAREVRTNTDRTSEPLTSLESLTGRQNSKAIDKLNMLQLVAPRLAYLFDDDAEAARGSARLNLLQETRARAAWLATSHLTNPFVDPRTLAEMLPAQ